MRTKALFPMKSCPHCFQAFADEIRTPDIDSLLKARKPDGPLSHREQELQRVIQDHVYKCHKYGDSSFSIPVLPRPRALRTDPIPQEIQDSVIAIEALPKNGDGLPKTSELHNVGNIVRSQAIGEVHPDDWNISLRDFVGDTRLFSEDFWRYLVRHADHTAL